MHGRVYCLSCSDGLLVFPSSKEKISELGIEPPTPLFGFGYLSYVIQHASVISNHTMEQGQMEDNNLTSSSSKLHIHQTY